MNFLAILEPNQVRLPGGPGNTCDSIDKVTGRLHFGVICLPFAPQESCSAFRIIRGAITDKRRILQVVYMLDQYLDLLGFIGRRRCDGRRRYTD